MSSTALFTNEINLPDTFIFLLPLKRLSCSFKAQSDTNNLTDRMRCCNTLGRVNAPDFMDLVLQKTKVNKAKDPDKNQRFPKVHHDRVDPCNKFIL